MARVDVKNLYYALLTQDNQTGVSSGAPIKLAGFISLDVKPASSSGVLYADGGPTDTDTVLGDIAVDIDNKDISVDHQAVLLGHSMANGGMKSNIGDKAPYVAIMFEGRKADGNKKFVKLYKGKFAEPSDSYGTKKDSVNFQTDKISGKFVGRQYDGEWKFTAEEDSIDYVPSVGAAWYTSVEPDADTTAPTIACTPADEATNVAVGTPVVLTFNKAMTISSLTDGGSFFLQKNDGTQVAGSGTWNAGHTVYTFTPSANLTAGATYNAIVTKAVKDLAGNALAAVNEFTFTVAA